MKCHRVDECMMNINIYNHTRSNVTLYDPISKGGSRDSVTTNLALYIEREFQNTDCAICHTSIVAQGTDWKKET